MFRCSGTGADRAASGAAITNSVPNANTKVLRPIAFLLSFLSLDRLIMACPDSAKTPYGPGIAAEIDPVPSFPPVP